MVTAADTQLQEAQSRLLKKREMLNLTGNPGQRIENINFQDIADRCMAMTKGDGAVYVDFKSDFKEELKPQKTRKLTCDVSGIPKAYNACDFENFTGNERLIKDLKSLSEFNRSIVLRGNTGCGKTHLAIALSKCIKMESHTCRRGYVPGGIFTTVPELLLKIRSSFRKDATESEESLIDYYTACDLLILDDLGAEKTSEFAITTLYLILDRRIREDRQMIITTNLTPTEIEQTFGARIASRMASMENIKITMPDYRKKRG